MVWSSRVLFLDAPETCGIKESLNRSTKKKKGRQHQISAVLVRLHATCGPSSFGNRLPLSGVGFFCRSEFADFDQDSTLKDLRQRCFVAGGVWGSGKRSEVEILTFLLSTGFPLGPNLSDPMPPTDPWFCRDSISTSDFAKKLGAVNYPTASGPTQTLTVSMGNCAGAIW